MNTADILDKAADLIEQRGWTQDKFIDANGCLCATGAMYVAVGIEPVQDRLSEEWPTFTERGHVKQCNAIGALEDWLNNDWGPEDYIASEWNDEDGRTKEEVVSTLRAAAQAARAEQ